MQSMKVFDDQYRELEEQDRALRQEDNRIRQEKVCQEYSHSQTKNCLVSRPEILGMVSFPDQLFWNETVLFPDQRFENSLIPRPNFV